MKINKLTQISEGLTRIPKTTLETVNQTKLPENIISLLEQAPTKDVADFANTLTDHSSMLETGSIASDSISQVAEHAGHNIFGGAMVFRLINPIRDFAKGNISAGLKRTSVNIVDYAIYKARLVYGGLGAIRGLIVKMRGGGDAPDAGFVNGFFYAMKHWGKGRKSVEEALINPKQFWQALKNNPLDAQYAIYNEERQNWLNKHKQSILQKSEINRKSIEDWGQARLQMLNSSQEMLRHMIAREQVIQQANQKQIINVEISNNELIGKLESLKVLQQSLLNDFNKCIKEMKETMQSIPSDSKEFETMQNIANLSNNYYAEEFNNINETINLADKILKFNELLHKKTSQKGFSRIAGYDDIKQILIKRFIKPVFYFDKNKKQIIPNVILFYGPKGCGKTLFANALGDETTSNVIKLELTLDSDNDFENLQKAIEEAKKLYEKNGKYSIIHIDEIDGFLSDKTYKSNETKNLVQSLSNNYCTIIATTNYPEKVNRSFISGQAIEKIYVGPPDKKNIQEVLKYYIKDFTDFEIDYPSLINILPQKINYNLSNAKIAESIIYALKKTLSETDNNLNQKYLEGIIAKIEPDITESSMKQYKGKDSL